MKASVMPGGGPVGAAANTHRGGRQARPVAPPPQPPAPHLLCCCADTGPPLQARREPPRTASVTPPPPPSSPAPRGSEKTVKISRNGSEKGSERQAKRQWKGSGSSGKMSHAERDRAGVVQRRGCRRIELCIGRECIAQDLVPLSEPHVHMEQCRGEILQAVDCGYGQRCNPQQHGGVRQQTAGRENHAISSMETQRKAEKDSEKQRKTTLLVLRTHLSACHPARSQRPSPLQAMQCCVRLRLGCDCQ